MSGSFAAEFNPAVSHTALKVSDLEAALRFYRDTIGLPFVRSQGPEERPAVVWLRGLQLVRRTPEEIGERGALDHIGLGIDNIEAVCARVEQDGTAVETALEHRVLPGGQEVMVAFYRDPEGNRVELLKYL